MIIYFDLIWFDLKKKINFDEFFGLNLTNYYQSFLFLFGVIHRVKIPAILCQLHYSLSIAIYIPIPPLPKDLKQYWPFSRRKKNYAGTSRVRNFGLWTSIPCLVITRVLCDSRERKCRAKERKICSLYQGKNNHA